MTYFTEREGMRMPIESTATISVERYAMLFDCCEKYFDHLAWKFPLKCPDGDDCCGLDFRKFSTFLMFEAPELFKNEAGRIGKPEAHDAYNQYALLDLIEIIGRFCRDIERRRYHSYHRHYDLDFAETYEETQKSFCREVNEVFSITRLLYKMTDKMRIERVFEHGVLTSEIEENAKWIWDENMRKLTQDAIALFKHPHPEQHRRAAEKLWDALEYWKTHFPEMVQKNRDKQLAEVLGGGQDKIATIFKDELSDLGNIGNNCNIRHFNERQIEITDERHIDYFFNRCLAFINTALQFS